MNKQTVVNIIALIFRKQHFFKRRGFLLTHPVESARRLYDNLCFLLEENLIKVTGQSQLLSNQVVALFSVR